MPHDKRARLKQWLESGGARLEPLTFPQRELWEASAVPLADARNHICCLIEVRGALTEDDCRSAVQRVVNRQEVLRLSFLPGKDQALQLIRAKSEAELEYCEIPQNRPDQIEDQVQCTFNEPFDLLGGPLYRARVIKRGAGNHVLVLAIHHAIADGWTLGIFVQDLCVAHGQRLAGLEQDLPPVAMSYAAWGAAERLFWQRHELEKRAQFWKARLAGRQRFWQPESDCNSSQNTLVRWVSSVAPELASATREMARRNGATLFSTLLAGFQLTLAQWTRSSDILVGTPVANRSRQAARETMGYFSGVVPLRRQIDPDQPFAQALAEVHHSTMDDFANALPFVELVRAVCDSPAPGYNPVYEVRFALQNHPIPDVDFQGLSVRLKMRATGTARFDLGCEITENGNAMEIVWLFQPRLFSQSDISELDRLFATVLARICRDPARRMAALMA